MIDFKVNDEGMLEAKGTFVSASEKKLLSKEASAVTNRWQFEILGIVCELLNYSVTITQRGETMTLEAEEKGSTHPCDYIKVTRTGDSAEIVFEHFKTEKALDVATAKFLTLADKLGVKIILRNRKVVEGEPFPNVVRHTHSHGHGHTHTHAHGRDDHEH
jgi:hypothetical protein